MSDQNLNKLETGHRPSDQNLNKLETGHRPTGHETDVYHLYTPFQHSSTVSWKHAFQGLS